MKSTLVLIAGAMFGSAALGAGGDQFAEQRHLAKYGRSMPAQEARLKGATAAPHGACCSGHRHDGLRETAGVNEQFVEERFRAKFGRNTPVQEARLKAAARELATHQNKCAELGQCPLIASHTAGARKAAAVTDSEARSLAKYGRVLQGAEPALEKAERAPAAGMDSGFCGHVCCE